MAFWTAFWSHPYHGSGSFTFDGPLSASDAADMAADEIADGLVDDEEMDEFEMSIVKDDLNLLVWSGAHLSQPSTPPDAAFV